MQTTKTAAATVTLMEGRRLRMKEPDNIDDKYGIEHSESWACDWYWSFFGYSYIPFWHEQQAFGDGTMVARSFSFEIHRELWMRNTN